MDDLLLDRVLDRLKQHELGESGTDLLLGALSGDEVLAEAVEGRARPRPAGRAAPLGVPVAAYLQSITVEGFRGIGPAATLELQPGPGLTVICGRNGSGKSSLAEAFEVLLTGGTHRWNTRSAVWRDTWRCLHSSETVIGAEILIEGSAGPTQLRRAWKPDDTKVGDAVTTVQRAGGGRESIEILGWGDALRTHRPFLSHAEVEMLLSEPKDLYNQLNDLLGLDDLEVALKRLGAAKRSADQESKVARLALPGLRAELEASSDLRAGGALGDLARTEPDLDRLRLLAGLGAGLDGGPMEVLGQLASLAVPAPAAVEAAAGELRQAVDALDRAHSSAAGNAAAIAGLLEAALGHTAVHSGGDCPVCGSPGVIDDDWRRRTEAEAARQRAAGAALLDAEGQVDSAARAARRLVGPVPVWLVRGPEAGVDTGEATLAWRAWAAVDEIRSDDFRALIGHLVGAHPPLVAAVETLVTAAAEERERQADRWAPLALRIGDWCEQAALSRAARTRLGPLKEAETWLKAAASDLRHERLSPFVDKTIELWRQLRQSSNVDLVEVRLVGAANRSRVDFAVTVDGAEAAGLGVMSQGEVNALALSVFLPRASMGGSPFGFVVIDDPVQAMDPSKVDGLARVLAETAADRQVIVFTHDDRLPESIRRLGLSARIMEVVRRPDSAIELRSAGDPSEMILRDAMAVARDAKVPPLVAARVVPALCRTAIETACIDIARRRRLGRGDTHAEVEAVIAGADRTMPRLALGIFDDPTRGGEVYRWLNERVSPWAANTVSSCQAGTHQGGDGDMNDLYNNVDRLVRVLRKQLR